MRVSSAFARISFRTVSTLACAALVLGLFAAGCGSEQEAVAPQQAQQQDALTQGGLNSPATATPPGAPPAAPASNAPAGH